MRTRGEVVFGGLNVLMGALMAWGGSREVLAYWPDGPFEVLVGACGILTGSLLLTSGLFLLARRASARRLAFAAGVTVIPVHAIGILAAIIGIPGIGFGVLYPLALLVWLWRWPGSPETTSRTESPASSPLKGDGGHRRAAIA